jgi:hypothetical protein
MGQITDEKMGLHLSGEPVFHRPERYTVFECLEGFFYPIQLKIFLDHPFPCSSVVVIIT